MSTIRMASPAVTSAEALANPYHPYVMLSTGFLRFPILDGTITDSHFRERDRMGRTLAFMARLRQDGIARVDHRHRHRRTDLAVHRPQRARHRRQQPRRRDLRDLRARRHRARTGRCPASRWSTATCSACACAPASGSTSSRARTTATARRCPSTAQRRAVHACRSVLNPTVASTCGAFKACAAVHCRDGTGGATPRPAACRPITDVEGVAQHLVRLFQPSPASSPRASNRRNLDRRERDRQCMALRPISTARRAPAAPSTNASSANATSFDSATLHAGDGGVTGGVRVRTYALQHARQEQRVHGKARRRHASPARRAHLRRSQHRSARW